MSREVVRGSFSFVTITEADQTGLKSLTNDMENILARLVREGRLRPGQLVIYQDSEGIWDQVLIDADCDLVAFNLLHADSEYQAISLIIEQTRQ